MNTELYDKWIKSHQIEDVGIDISASVIGRIGKNPVKPNTFQQICENILLDLSQTKVLVRACILTSGAMMGFLRIIFQVYSVLFT